MRQLLYIYAIFFAFSVSIVNYNVSRKMEVECIYYMLPLEVTAYICVQTDVVLGTALQIQTASNSKVG